MTDLKSMMPEELEVYFEELGQPRFRAMQVFRWLHHGVESFSEMTNLPRALRERLETECVLTVPRVERKQVSKLDGTIKYLWRLGDGNCVETVLMRYKHGNTVCVSSQVGCNMGCVFCASTLGGKVRDLTPAEILDQVIFTEKDSGETVSNIVMMGIGEPLDNFDHVLRFLSLINHPDGMNIGMRHISLSVGVDLLMDTCRRYFETTGRRISYEYAMVEAVNDSDEQADRLAELLRGQPGHVNLIPLNEVAESPLKPSRRVRQFQQRLESRGATATVRRKLGGDIDASCGQLRRRRIMEGETHTPEEGLT